MSKLEFSQPSLPQNSIVYYSADLIKVLMDEIPNNDGIRILSGAILKGTPAFNKYYQLQDGKEYILVNSAKITDTLDFNSIKSIAKRRDNFGIIFINCILQKIIVHDFIIEDILFISSHLNELQITNSIVGHVVVDDKSLIKVVSVENSSNVKGITISEHSQVLDLRIRNFCKCGVIATYTRSRVGYFSIESTSITESVWFSNESECGRINLGQNCAIVGDLKIDYYSSCEDINMNYFQCRALVIEKGSSCQNISLFEKSNIEVLRIEDKSSIVDLRMGNESRIYGIVIKDSSASSIFINGNFCGISAINATIFDFNISKSFIIELYWNGVKGGLYVNDSILNEINLVRTSVSKDAVVSIINSSAYNVTMQELLVSGILIFRNLSKSEGPFIWDPIRLETFKKSNTIYFNDIAKEIDAERKDIFYRNHDNYVKYTDSQYRNRQPTFSIINSSLGKSEFTGCDFTKFLFVYRNSKILEIFLSGSVLPKDQIIIYNSNHPGELASYDQFEQKASIYNQLKRVFDNQGDIPQSTWYHSKAMKNIEALLNLKASERPKNILANAHNLLDRKSFSLNGLSNNHGESWPKALVFVLVLTIIFYSAYHISIFYYLPFSFSGSGDFIGNLFLFLDPLHKSDFLVDKERLNWVSKVIDFFGRLTIGYGIYQLIAAFRRHGKKV